MEKSEMWKWIDEHGDFGFVMDAKILLEEDIDEEGYGETMARWEDPDNALDAGKPYVWCSPEEMISCTEDELLEHVNDWIAKEKD